MNTNLVMLKVGSFLAALAFSPLLSTGMAQEFENGDFSRGRERWLGDGKLVYLTADGQFSDKKGDGTPIMEIPLKKMDFSDLHQRFHSREKLTAMKVEIVFRASAGFLRNDNARKYTGVSWKPGSLWYWSGNEFPRVDLCLKLKQPTGFCYGLSAVKPGGDWQTYKVHWEELRGTKDHDLFILAPPGDGSLYIKSIVVE